MLLKQSSPDFGLRGSDDMQEGENPGLLFHSELEMGRFVFRRQF